MQARTPRTIRSAPLLSLEPGVQVVVCLNTHWLQRRDKIAVDASGRTSTASAAAQRRFTHYAAVLLWVAWWEVHLVFSACASAEEVEDLALIALTSTTVLPPCVILACLSRMTDLHHAQRLHVGLLVWGTARFVVAALSLWSEAQVTLASSVILESLFVVASSLWGLMHSAKKGCGSVWGYMRQWLLCRNWRSVVLGIICIAGPCIGTAYAILPLATFQPSSLAASANSTGTLLIQLVGCSLVFSHTAFFEVKLASDGQASAASYPMLVVAGAVGVLEMIIFLGVRCYTEAIREALITVVLVLWFHVDSPWQLHHTQFEAGFCE